MDEIEHGSHSASITGVNLSQKTFQSLALLKFSSLVLTSANSSQLQELRQKKQVILLLLDGSCSSLGLGRTNSLLQLLA